MLERVGLVGYGRWWWCGGDGDKIAMLDARASASVVMGGGEKLALVQCGFKGWGVGSEIGLDAVTSAAYACPVVGVTANAKPRLVLTCWGYWRAKGQGGSFAVALSSSDDDEKMLHRRALVVLTRMHRSTVFSP